MREQGGREEGGWGKRERARSEEGEGIMEERSAAQTHNIIVFWEGVRAPLVRWRRWPALREEHYSGVDCMEVSGGSAMPE